MTMIRRLIEEPPFRLLSYYVVRRFARSVATIDRWAAVPRPNYFAGLLAAARLARADGIPEISAIEFGVAGGNGLLALQDYAEKIERAEGVKISVFGFDTAVGLPKPCGDYRDHPDQWIAGDYRMDVPRLESRLSARSKLVLGDLLDTIPSFRRTKYPPIGFVSCDVDLYSSTNSALSLLSGADRRVLRRVFMYFDDIDFVFNHRFAGEWLSISEFNHTHERLKIDRWYGIRKDRVFRDESWLDKMFVLHDLDAIEQHHTARAPSTGCAID